MRCSQHLSMECLSKRDYCTLCEDGPVNLTARDRLYCFQATVPGTSQKVDIYSKRQWRMFKKQHGQTDDFDSTDKMESHARRQHEYRNEKRRQFVTQQVGKLLQDARQGRTLPYGQGRYALVQAPK